MFHFIENHYLLYCIFVGVVCGLGIPKLMNWITNH